MEELAVFYDENQDDDKIHFFENLRLRLKKTLQVKVMFQGGQNEAFGMTNGNSRVNQQRSLEGTANNLNGYADGLRVGPDIDDSMMENTNDEFARQGGQAALPPMQIHTNGTSMMPNGGGHYSNGHNGDSIN